MSEFHRMITYLNLYEQGSKNRNIGFAKIEKRENRCLIEIHMKNTGYSTAPIPVYFYTRKQQTLPGILLGSMGLSHGNGDYKVILNAENLADSGYSLEDIKGIFIPLSDEVMIVSQWDDDEFVREQFIEPSKNEEEKIVSKESNNTEEASEKGPQITDRNPNNSSNNITSDNATDDGSNHTPSGSAVESQAKNTTSTEASSDITATEAAPKLIDISRREPRNSNISDSKNKKEKPEDWNLKWKFILENYPVMTPFAGDENTLCVRFELKDLRLLPKQYWYLGNNSFLLHGFFNYRYLILGMTEKSGNKRWFIGIPGVFQNPERVMATLFGFPEFRNEKSAPINTGEFGYWYRYLN